MKVKDFKSFLFFKRLGNFGATYRVYIEGSRCLASALLLALILMGAKGVSMAFAQEAGSEDEQVESGSYESFKLLIERNIFDPQRRKPIPFAERTAPPPPAPPREEAFSLVGVFMNGKDKVAFFEGSNNAWSGSRKVGESIAGFVLEEVEFSHARLTQKTGKLNSEGTAESSDSDSNTKSQSAETLKLKTVPELEVVSVSEVLTGLESLLVANDPDNSLIEETFHLMVGQSMRRTGDSPWDLQDSEGEGVRTASLLNPGSESPVEESSGDSDAATDSEASAADSDGGGMSEVLRKMMERRKQEINK